MLSDLRVEFWLSPKVPDDILEDVFVQSSKYLVGFRWFTLLTGRPPYRYLPS
jgi:hypothetical protein